MERCPCVSERRWNQGARWGWVLLDASRDSPLLDVGRIKWVNGCDGEALWMFSSGCFYLPKAAPSGQCWLQSSPWEVPIARPVEDLEVLG